MPCRRRSLAGLLRENDAGQALPGIHLIDTQGHIDFTIEAPVTR